MYEAVIGLEVHLQLKTLTKAFCGCSTEFGKEPNSQTCPVCLGFPGSLPVLNKQALDSAVKVGIALNCRIQEQTKFDRKNYFYPDLPKNYQISQYDLPLAKNGFLNIDIDGVIKRIGITRVHLEEDAGKLIHKDNLSQVDFNRTGIPLLEIVSEPDMNLPQEAYEYLTTLKSLIEYLEVSDCDMEKGSLRCDANISIRKKGERELGVKTELKNMNSFKAVKDALNFEIERQIGVLNSGGAVKQDTRLWDAKELKTVPMRSKEEAKDYRYFPGPDLPMFIITADKVEEIKKTSPELPREKMRRFIKDYSLSDYDAKILVLSKKDADYAEKCIQAYPSNNKKVIVNWLSGALLSEANIRNCHFFDLNFSAEKLVELVSLVDKDLISNLAAKSVLKEMVDTGASAADIIKNKNLAQISNSDMLEAGVDEIIKGNSKSVQDYKAGKVNALMFLVGQVMKKTAGKANPKVVQEILKQKLDQA